MFYCLFLNWNLLTYFPLSTLSFLFLKYLHIALFSDLEYIYQYISISSIWNILVQYRIQLRILHLFSVFLTALFYYILLYFPIHYPQYIQKICPSLPYTVVATSELLSTVVSHYFPTNPLKTINTTVVFILSTKAVLTSP